MDFGFLKGKYDDFVGNLEKYQSKIKEYEKKFDDLVEQVKRLEGRVNDLEKKIGNNKDDFGNK